MASNNVTTEVRISNGAAMEIGIDAASESRSKPLLNRMLFQTLKSYRDSGGNLERVLREFLRLLGYRASIHLVKIDEVDRIAVPKKKKAVPYRDQ